MKTAYLYSLILLFFSFYPVSVHIQPLGHVPDSHIKNVQQAIRSVYGFECKLLPTVEHDSTLYTKRKVRYNASRILEKFEPSSSNHVLVLTQRDIAHYKDRKHPEWGVLGLGSLTKQVCVVSTYRMGSDQLDQRLAKVAVHEIGHTLGLNHCTSSSTCVMRDAKGTVKTIDKVSLQLCKTCKRRISSHPLNFLQ